MNIYHYIDRNVNKQWPRGVFTEKLISGTREALCVTGSPGHSQSPPTGGGSSGMGSRRGSISSLSSVTSMLEEKDDEKIRCCHHCMDTLLKRQQKLEEKDHVPDIVKLYEVNGSFAVSPSLLFLFSSRWDVLPVIHSNLSFGVSCGSLGSNLVFLSEVEDVHGEGGRKGSGIHQNGRVPQVRTHKADLQRQLSAREIHQWLTVFAAPEKPHTTWTLLVDSGWRCRSITNSSTP